MRKYLRIYFVFKHTFLCFFLPFCIRYPKIVKSEITKQALFA